jgi:hypothetical protein
VLFQVSYLTMPLYMSGRSPQRTLQYISIQKISLTLIRNEWRMIS